MPALQQTERRNARRSPGIPVPVRQPRRGWEPDSARWGICDQPVWRTSDAGCLRAPCQCRMCCGCRGRPDADAVQGQQAHTVPRPHLLLPPASYAVLCRWRVHPDSVLNPRHRARPEQERICRSRTHRRCRQFSRGERPHLYFSGCEPARRGSVSCLSRKVFLSK